MVRGLQTVSVICVGKRVRVHLSGGCQKRGTSFISPYHTVRRTVTRLAHRCRCHHLYSVGCARCSFDRRQTVIPTYTIQKLIIHPVGGEGSASSFVGCRRLFQFSCSRLVRVQIGRVWIAQYAALEGYTKTNTLRLLFLALLRIGFTLGCVKGFSRWTDRFVCLRGFTEADREVQVFVEVIWNW